MQIIIISSNSKTHKHWHLSRTRLFLLFSFVFSLAVFSAFQMANWLSQSTATESVGFSHQLGLEETDELLPNALTEDEAAVQTFYAQQLGGLQAETIRLKMFTERLAEVAGFDSAQFSMDEHPPQGGIEEEGLVLDGKALDDGIKQLSLALQNQGEALAAIEQYLITQDSIEAGIPDGKPVNNGWVSSFYGNRIDPFNGRKTFHKGIDIAGKTGTPVVASADGIVTWVGERSGYGGLVEIDHGNGYMTRYAHNKTLKVTQGQRVNKGDVLALMGSTGRSTGPHVHYEVLRDGIHVNPYNFIK